MYELTYIVNPNLSEGDLVTLNEKVKNFITEQEGQIKNEKISPKKQLSYSIKKNDSGYYVSFDFTLRPAKIKDLDEKIKSEDKILRQLIIIKQEKKIAAPLKPVRTILTKKAPPKKEKVKLEELDKKLEEILEE